MEQLNIRLNQVINVVRLFHRKEIVLHKGEYSIFNGIKADIVLPLETSLFVDYGILQLDSGNYETGEQCFVVEMDREVLKKNIIKLANKRGNHSFDSFTYLIRDKKISQILES